MAYVYLITEQPYEDESIKEWVKIGYSQNTPEWRMNANLKRGNPRNIQVAAAFEYKSNDEAKKAEKEAHQEFKDYLYQKEWFQMDWRIVNEWFLNKGASHRSS